MQEYINGLYKVLAILQDAEIRTYKAGNISECDSGFLAGLEIADASIKSYINELEKTEVFKVCQH